MRVKKLLDGTFAVEDEPMRLEGAAADRFVREMHDRDEIGDNTLRRQFLEECDRVYQASVAKRDS